MTDNKAGIVVSLVLDNIMSLARETSQVSISAINSVLPPDFPIFELDFIFESLWDNRITVTDDLNDSLNIEPFLRRGELSRPSKLSDEIRDGEAELLVHPVKSYLNQLNSIEHRESSNIDQMVTDHLGLVVKVARRYKRSGVSLMELILAGNEGLVEASLHFDPSKGKTFASIARWWIGHHLSKCIAENWRASRIPRAVAVNLRRIAKVVARYRGKKGIDPSPRFLARALAIKLDEIFFLKGLFESPLSLYGPASAESSDVTLVDTVADKEAPNGADMIEKVCKRESVLELLGKLDSLPRQILSLRFGLDDGLTKSAFDVAKLLVIPVEQVKYIEKKSIEELRIR